MPCTGKRTFVDQYNYYSTNSLHNMKINTAIYLQTLDYFVHVHHVYIIIRLKLATHITIVTTKLLYTVNVAAYSYTTEIQLLYTTSKSVGMSVGVAVVGSVM